jgi:hypothetical protein
MREDADANNIREDAPNTKSDSGAELAGEPHEDLAADAAAYLERSGASIESIGGVSQEIDRQASRLIQWARQRGVLLAEDYTGALLRHQSTTAEHQVFYRAADNRAVKCTYAGTFGVTPDPKGAQRAATPLFYLRRVQLMNQVFRSDLRLEGVMFGKSLLIGAVGEQASIVVSQPWIRRADPDRPHPSENEIAEFMKSLGFVMLSRSYFGWQRSKDQITILDARGDNFIKSAEGVVPIDLVVSQKVGA